MNDPLQRYWHRSDNVLAMLGFLRQNRHHGNRKFRFYSNRKLRLFGVACLKLSWQFFTEMSLKNVILAIEDFVDDNIAYERLVEFKNLIVQPRPFAPADRCKHSAVFWLTDRISDKRCGWEGIECCIGNVEQLDGYTKSKEHVDLLHDILGNPFSSFPILPHSQNIEHIAQSCYNNDNFDDLPILADALEDAGCTEIEILNHCRGKNKHVKGCWVVDLVLGKS